MYHSHCLYTGLPICCCPEGDPGASATACFVTDAADVPSTAADDALTAAGGTAGWRSQCIDTLDSSLTQTLCRLSAGTALFHENVGEAGWRNMPALLDANASAVVDILSIGREVSRQRRKFLRGLKLKARQKKYCLFCGVGEVNLTCLPSTVCGECRFTKLPRRPLSQQQGRLHVSTGTEKESNEQHSRQQQRQRKSGLFLVDCSRELTESDAHQREVRGERYGNTREARSAPAGSSFLPTALLSGRSSGSTGGTESVPPLSWTRDSRTAAASSRAAGHALKQRHLRVSDYLSVNRTQDGGDRRKERQEKRRERGTHERGQSSYCQLRRCKRKSDPTDMLTCCTCGLTNHASCCDPPLRFDTVTRFPWQCPDCKLCVVCEFNVSEETMLICDACDRAYHMECLKPPVVEIPEGKWFCTDCWRCCSTCRKKLSEGKTREKGDAAVEEEPMCRACASFSTPRSKRAKGGGTLSSSGSVTTCSISGSRPSSTPNISTSDSQTSTNNEGTQAAAVPQEAIVAVRAPAAI